MNIKNDKLSMLYRTIILLLITLLIGQMGCAHKPYEIPPRLSLQDREQLGTIGVVSGRFIPEAEFHTPARGKAGGAARGTAIGAVAGLELVTDGAANCYGESCLGMIILLPAAAIIGGLYGGIAGAVKAESTEKIENAEAAIREFMAELNIQEVMRNRVLQVARDQTRHHFIFLLEQGPSTHEEEVDYSSLFNQGIDTILEISVMTFGLTGEWSINPPLMLFMNIRIKLIRTENRKVLYLYTFDLESEEHKFTDWGDNNAQLLREKFDLFYQHLAETIVDEML